MNYFAVQEADGRYFAVLNDKEFEGTLEEFLGQLADKEWITWEFSANVPTVRTLGKELSKAAEVKVDLSDVVWLTVHWNRYVGSSKQILDNLKRREQVTAFSYLKRDVDLVKEIHEFIMTYGYFLIHPSNDQPMFWGERKNSLVVKIVL
jgi:hypothetical protein